MALAGAGEGVLATDLAGGLGAIAGSIRTFQEELNDLFPEREALITQLIYGLLTREHVLVFGKFGTGKSRLVESFFGAFTAANLFSLELTKFMTESNIIGIPNPKTLRENGRIWHEREGTMLDAHFVELDEFFDANDFVVRVMLGILNERRFKRGIQFERANLHTAVASTNASPEQELKRAPTLGAVVDRFLFQTQVQYLTKDESRRRMYANYLQDRRPSVQIPYPSIDALAHAVIRIPMNDPTLIELHNQIIQEFQKKRNVMFSDRRACQTLKLVQANALLYGRGEVIPDDFLAEVWALGYGDDATMHEEFKAIATPLIDKFVKEAKPDIVRTQIKLLDELKNRLPTLSLNGSVPPVALTSDELVSLRRTLVALEGDVRGLKASHASIEDRQKELLVAIESMKSKVGGLIDGVAST